MERPANLRDLELVGAVDARDIRPVQDSHGGLTIYYRGRPTHYLLEGEWYHAFPEPTGNRATADVSSGPSKPHNEIIYR